MEPFRKPTADSRNGREHGFGVRGAPEAVQHRKTAAREQFADRARNGRTDSGYFFESPEPALPKHVVHRLWPLPHTCGCSQVGIDAETIGTLFVQQARRFL